VVTTYHGSPADIDLAYAQLGSYIAEHVLTVGWQLPEYCHRDHSQTTDSDQWHTEIAWPVIDVTEDRGVDPCC
jgi:effector-binding domain-containing protein